MIKKRIERFAKYAGLATVCFEWLALAIFVVLRPDFLDGHHPLSDYASLPETRVVFSVCLTIAASCFWVFTRFHLPKFYDTPIKLFAASMLGYAALALVPFDPSSAASDAIHKVFALFFSVSLIVGIFIMGTRNKDAGLRNASYLTVAISTITLLLFLTTTRDSPFFLLLESMGALTCQVWIVWISFHSFRRLPKAT